MQEQLIYAIALSEIKGIGPVYFKKLLDFFETPKDVFSASLSDLLSCIPQRVAEEILKNNLQKAEKIFTISQKHDIGITFYGAEDYPERLLNIHLPPPVLYVKGDIKQIDNVKSVGIVGTRKPTQYGVKVTSDFSRVLAKHRVAIVSGGAYGIDTFALRGAVENGAYAVAVLGNGLLNPYPASNRGLFRKIVETGGAVISEFPPETRPSKENFPRRNRIISALSDVLLVVEAGEKSGSLITAAWATEQNIEVYAVPGPITAQTSKGTNLLIREGAKMALSPDDILNNLGVGRKKEESNIQLTEDEEKIYNMITEEPIHIDALSEKVGIEVFNLIPLLFSLELKGVIRQLPGKYYIRELSL